MTSTARASTAKAARIPSAMVARGSSAAPGTAMPESAADALEALGEIEFGMRSLEVKRVRLIGAAQQLGASWDDIGSALGISRQAAWEKYRDQARELLAVTADRAQLPEEAILQSAAEVLKEVRARRRRR